MDLFFDFDLEKISETLDSVVNGSDFMSESFTDYLINCEEEYDDEYDDSEYDDEDYNQ